MPLSKDDLKSILDRVQQMTFAVDQKVNVLMVIQTLVLSFVLPDTLKWFREPGTGGWTKAGIVIGVGVLVVAVAHALLTVFPRIGNPTGFSVSFFGNIGSVTVEDYRKAVAGIGEDDFCNDYVSQIHVCSVIALTKHQTFKVSAWLFVGGLGILGITYLLSLSW